MSRKNYIFTSESVSEGHPDKVCDRISDAVLDAFLTEEPNARVACETFATTNRVVVGGEVGLSDPKRLEVMLGRVDAIVRDCVRDIGYEQDEFHWSTLEISNYLHKQSAHIAQGVDKDGAGDQGIMFGYACSRNAGADAGADPLCPCDPAPSDRGAQVGRCARPAPGCEIAALGCAMRMASRSR